MTPKRIGLIGFDGVTALHLVAPAEAFCAAALDDGYGGRIPCYEVCTIGVHATRFRAESGVQFEAQASLDSAPACETVIVAGGPGIRQPQVSEAVSDYLSGRAMRSARVASICTGIYGVAPTGFLDGREATVHWRYASDVAQRFPRIMIDHKRPLVRDGAVYTSSGLSAGINLSLALIRDDYGPHVAQAVERDLALYSTSRTDRETLDDDHARDVQPNERFADLVPWIVRNLHADLSVEVLARRSCMCPDHFSKAFKSVFGEPPKLFVENLRLNEARRRLSKRQKTVRSVATSVGFGNADAFQRAFQRRFGRRATSYLADPNATRSVHKVAATHD